MAKELITVKGTRNGLIFYFNTKEGSFEEIHKTLMIKFQEANGFFDKANFIINEENDLNEQQIKIIEEVLINHGMTQGHINKTVHPQKFSSPLISGDEEIEGYNGVNDAVLIFRNLRSGQKIYVNGHAIIRGDVNPGAEVIATGNIIVMGTFRGIAHAGVKGNDQAIVMACRLRPTQIAISDLLTRSPEIREDSVYPEIAFIANNQIIVEPYQTSKRKVANF